MDKITSLSQAIRIGSSYTSQCRDTYVEGVNDQGVPAMTCALGAAWLALNNGEWKGIASHDVFADLERRFPVAASRWALSDVIDWNDQDGLTREEIADRLEKQGL